MPTRRGYREGHTDTAAKLLIDAGPASVSTTWAFS
jgi:hypothetical protein